LIPVREFVSFKELFVAENLLALDIQESAPPTTWPRGFWNHEANSGMLSAGDPPRMALGLTEPTFQVQIVWR